MKLFARVKEIRPARQGVSQRTGNQWTAWPVVFEDNQAENAIIVDIFREQLPEGIHPGAEGWLIYGMGVFAAQNGSMYNQVRFIRFDNVTAANGAQATNAHADGQPTAPAPQTPANAAQSAPASPAVSPDANGALPF